MQDHCFRSTLARVREKLLAGRLPAGYWVGELSTSALSTATASFALASLGRERHQTRVARGLAWLVAHANADGGWGDTVASKSNVSTTALCRAALSLDTEGASCAAAARRADDWLACATGGSDPEALARALAQRYGKDRTFAVPILTMCALAGMLGADGWRLVPVLPYELAALPQALFRYLRLPVVSYALPALIAMGQVRDAHRRLGDPLRAMIRRLVRPRTMAVLEAIQPSSGGFLEATPLTSFVAMSLAGAGLGGCTTAKRAEDFLLFAQRADGSWPIDSNLSVWLTSLAVNALAADGEGWDAAGGEWRERLLARYLKWQYRERHPYTGAAPGGWAWTHLPGGVPDADDTAGALLALRRLDRDGVRTIPAARMGLQWLLDLQNSDGGVPTFCRGWGHLPFDRSGADLTAHALRAWNAWLDVVVPSVRGRVRAGIERGIAYLKAVQRADGSWLPLWFGNEHVPGEENPTYGTARVVTALAALEPVGGVAEACMRGVRWLCAAQQPDGAFGGAPGVPPTIEETAVAVSALADAARQAPELAEPVARGGAWLAARTEGGNVLPAAPIGFYFAKLWYHEEAYPCIFTAEALGKALALRA